jgi:hypothetical protein
MFVISISPTKFGGDSYRIQSLTSFKSTHRLRPNMASHPTPSIVTSPISPNHRAIPRAIRRDRSPPRNSSGNITCDHSECLQVSPPTFRRLSEWNRHMDHHERPYKCHEPGCEASRGFTYPGGLLRHQREVHKVYLTSSKKLMFCPFPNCERASGNGFNRKNNLEEHKRRKHPVLHSPLGANLQPGGQASLKRRRLTTSQQYTIDYQDNNDDDDDLVNEGELTLLVNHLYTRLAQKDKLIETQATEISRLYGTYGVNPKPIHLHGAASS